MTFRAEIKIMPVPEILDPQGKAISAGLENLGIQGVQDARMGKHIQLEVSAATVEEAHTQVEEACRKLLVNPIMETYSFQIEALEEATAR